MFQDINLLRFYPKYDLFISKPVNSYYISQLEKIYIFKTAVKYIPVDQTSKLLSAKREKRKKNEEVGFKS